MIYSATLPAQAAGGTDVVAVAGVYKPAFYSGDTVTDVTVVAPEGFSAVVGAAANNVTLSVRQLRGGVVQQTFVSLTVAAGTSLIAKIPVNLAISAQPVLLADDVIDVQMHQNGSGVAIGPGLIASVYVS